MEQSHILQKEKICHVSFVFIDLIKSSTIFHIQIFDDINVKHKKIRNFKNSINGNVNNVKILCIS